ncbi:hypothetical protein [Bacteroides pyogenes]|uniref:hypothetical protein n=1 Tax=Bacteroides pyogenes TaxID=310300 RepID=UPI002FDA135C
MIKLKDLFKNKDKLDTASESRIDRLTDNVELLNIMKVTDIVQNKKRQIEEICNVLYILENEDRRIHIRTLGSASWDKNGECTIASDYELIIKDALLKIKARIENEILEL